MQLLCIKHFIHKLFVAHDVREILVIGFLSCSHDTSQNISSNITESKTKTKKNMTSKPGAKGESEI